MIYINSDIFTSEFQQKQVDSINVLCVPIMEWLNVYDWNASSGDCTSVYNPLDEALIPTQIHTLLASYGLKA